MKEKTTIAVVINGAAIQCNISRNTTCDDIIKLAAKHTPQSQNTATFAVFEAAYGVEKMLPGQTKVLKLARSWGVDRRNFSVEVREVTKVKSNMASITRAKKKWQRLRSLKNELEYSEKFRNDLNHNIAANAINKDDKYFDKNITVIDHTSKRVDSRLVREVVDKKELLKRYLNDSIEYGVTMDTYCNEINLPVRTRGVGCENDSAIQSGLPERTQGDGEESLNCNTVAGGEQRMNKAFINSEMFAESYNGSDELNECILYDTDETSSDYEESAFEDDSDYDSICELERNITESYTENTYTQINELKRIFSNGDLNARITEDDLLDSFMNTFVHDDDSDEGMSSVNSDFE